EGFFVDGEVQAFVELLLLPDRGGRSALIIMFGIDNRVVLRPGSLFNERGSCEVIDMDVCFDDEADGQSKFLGNSDVALDIFDDGIDNDCLARTAISYDVGSTFRSVIDILCLVDIQQYGNNVGVSDRHGFLFSRPTKLCSP